MMHAYPGLGATSAMFGEPWRARIPGAYHDWPEWSGESTLRELAEHIVERDGIKDGDRLLGTSLGGMVAVEIGKLRKLELVTLIASAVHRDEVSTLLEFLHPLTDLAPIQFIKACAGKIPLEVTDMFAHSEPAFIRAMVKAIFRWEGIGSQTPVVRIHGTDDVIIPCPGNVDCRIYGGHLIAMTHSHECIDWILENHLAR